MLAHVTANLRPNITQNTLALMLTSAILVRSSKVSKSKWSIDGGYDLSECDLRWIPREYVPPTGPPTGGYKTCTF